MNNKSLFIVYISVFYISLVTILYSPSLVVNSIFICTSLLLLSTTLTKKYNEIKKYSIAGFSVLLFSIVLTLLLMYLKVDNNYIVIINIVLFIVSQFIYFVVSNNHKETLLLNKLHELVVSIQSFPWLLSISLVIVYRYLIIETNKYFIFKETIDQTFYVLLVFGFIGLIILLIRRNLLFVKRKFNNVDRKDIIRFINITSVNPIIGMGFIYIISVLFALDNKTLDIGLLSFVFFIFHYIYIRNFVISYIDINLDLFRNEESSLKDESNIIDI